MRAAESFNQNRNIAQLAKKTSKIDKATAYFSNDFPPFGRLENTQTKSAKSCPIFFLTC